MATPISNPNPETAAPKSSTTVNIDDTSELRRVFKQFDTNGDGKISASELGEVLKSMGTTYTREELLRVMEEVDTDKDGHIDVTEFAQLCRSSAAAASELRDAFDLYDQNGDGMISATELHQVLNRLGMKCKVDECLQMIKNVDSDSDGCVNFEEFQKMMAAKHQ
ncbi:hypothetical protein OIU77_001916 [Salix suchowensis]|uniref:EF-hand domain-containing protein n=1 Tax=Salix suchowensis TaxID=1278906 RepID=A0ABQ9B595_9ROSI|nr:hypothetical protein OIU77_001916 [Salix suchowensis]